MNTAEKRAKARAYRLKKKYNLTVEEYKKIFDLQKGCCAICRRPATRFKHGLHVDHDHASKLVRGLLCWPCNSLLPSRMNLIELLGFATEYLQFPPAVLALQEQRLCGKPVKRK